MITQRKIGLALGSGSSRGWSHIGIIKTLSEIGIEPDIICGTSIGALVGAAYVSNNLDKLEQWVRSLSKLDTAKFFEINTSLTGFVNTDRFHKFLNRNVASDEVVIEKLEKFAPRTLGDAKRIPGITPASIINLHIAISLHRKKKPPNVSRETPN